MKTIFITIDWFHPAYKAGGPVQSIANLTEQYGDGQVKYKIFCSNTDLDGSINSGVLFDTWCNYNEHTTVWYASKNKRSVEILKREIKNSNADILFVIGIYSWYFNLVPLLFCKVAVKIISVRGMLHPGALSQKSFKKKLYLALWKMAGLHRRYNFHATDAQEQQFILQAFGEQARVFIAGNFPRVFNFQQAAQKETGKLRLVSVALISPMKNILLVLEALHFCTAEISYDIYGPIKDGLYWQLCRDKIKMLPANITVCHHGDVLPSKIEAVLNNYEVFILPSKSENFGHAIYEALSAGKPVITSNHTPFNNLQSNHAGENISTKNISEITTAINFFAAMSAAEFKSWNEGAKSYASRQVDFNELKVQNDNMFLQKF